MGEVAELGFRAGRTRAECGRVLPLAGNCQITVLLLEKTTAASREATVCGSAGGEAEGRDSGSVPGSTIEVRLRNGRSLLVGPGSDASQVRAFLAVVESESCYGCLVCTHWAGAGRAHLVSDRSHRHALRIRSISGASACRHRPGSSQWATCLFFARDGGTD